MSQPDLERQVEQRAGNRFKHLQEAKMDSTPYAAPSNAEASRDGVKIRHKQFVGKTVSFSLMSLDDLRETTRQQAEDFINMEAGVENVISVNEHAMSLGPFTVVVWYRSKS